MTKPKPATLCAQLGHFTDAETGDVVPPIRPSTTYARSEDYALRGPEYSRDQNPTYHLPERIIAQLEGGADAALFASGQAAGNAVFSILRTGDRMALPSLGYHALLRQMTALGKRYGIGIDRYLPGDTDSLAQAIHSGHTKLVWAESPSNPSWVVTDIAAAADLAHQAGAILAVDNTAMTPMVQRPLDHGADIIMHSATKGLNGHSDVLAGALVTRAGLKVWEAIKAFRGAGGAVLGPFEAWLLARGLRTLPLRMERQCATAKILAETLSDHPAVERVLYPGLPSDPGHDVHIKQTMSGAGAGSLLSFLVKGDKAATKRVVTATKIFIPATSIGGVESLIEHRAIVEGPDSSTPINLIRLSIGLEDPEDLQNDLQSALSK